MHEEVPNVVRLALHLPGMHYVMCNYTEPMEEVEERAKHKQSTLIAFFKLCSEDVIARDLTYQKLPET